MHNTFIYELILLLLQKMNWFLKNWLLVSTIIAVVFGALFGFILRSLSLSPQSIMLISFPGEILMHMLKMMILPLITSSLISGLNLFIEFELFYDSKK